MQFRQSNGKKRRVALKENFVGNILAATHWHRLKTQRPKSIYHNTNEKSLPGLNIRLNRVYQSKYTVEKKTHWMHLIVVLQEISPQLENKQSKENHYYTMGHFSHQSLTAAQWLTARLSGHEVSAPIWIQSNLFSFFFNCHFFLKPHHAREDVEPE